MTERPPTPDEMAGIEWWNLLDEQGRRHWTARAGDTGRAADAWSMFKHDVGADLEGLQSLVDQACSHGGSAQTRLQALGASLLESGDVETLCSLQAALHDRAIALGMPGSRGSAIGSFWEHLPEWAAL